MQKVLVVEESKCTGCRMCELVCSLERTGECNASRASIKVMKDELQGVDLPVTCMHCSDPACAEVCPTGAMVKHSRTGIVSVKKDLCMGCKMCVLVCPVGAVAVDPKDPYGPVLKCDLCGGDPQCVQFCQTQAIRLVPAEDLGSETRQKVLRAFLRAAREAV